MKKKKTGRGRAKRKTAAVKKKRKSSHATHSRLHAVAMTERILKPEVVQHQGMNCPMCFGEMLPRKQSNGSLNFRCKKCGYAGVTVRQIKV